MIEQLITFETAKLAKEKGFDIGDDYSRSYNESGDIVQAGNQNYDEIMYAVSQAALQTWLRTNHRINVESNWLPNIGKFRTLYKPMDIKPKDFNSGGAYHMAVDKFYSKKNHSSYESALEEGLQEGLKLIKIKL